MHFVTDIISKNSGVPFFRVLPFELSAVVIVVLVVEVLVIISVLSLILIVSVLRLVLIVSVLRLVLIVSVLWLILIILIAHNKITFRFRTFRI